jgi:hypothetical protein
MKGDGVIDIPLIRGAVEAAIYADQVEGEIFSDRDWRTRPPDETLSVCAGRPPKSACVSPGSSRPLRPCPQSTRRDRPPARQ